MDSVYDAALSHAEKLKAELASLQTFLDLHDHFRERFGLTSPAATSSAETKEAALTPEPEIAEEAGVGHEIHVKESSAEDEDEDAAEAHTLKADAVEPAEDEASVAEDETSDDQKPRVIQASEGVLITTSTDAPTTAPLGPEATLQSVAEKLAATISSSHPSVTGYTV